MPLDHFFITVPASELDGLVTFLISSLQHIGFKEYVRTPTHAGLGDGTPYLWIAGDMPEDVEKTIRSVQKDLFTKQHVAFSAKNADQVRKFHEAALEAGGISNGLPGLRSIYGPTYYAAFVRDPVLGINFEVVCHSGEA
ncbi:hypothetical protein B7494_g132 [Chlorociboria aeruginascens]|nr:hypothetical protein B7494_g132 [Chlorociboria aeruginascens]